MNRNIEAGIRIGTAVGIAGGVIGAKAPEVSAHDLETSRAIVATSDYNPANRFAQEIEQLARVDAAVETQRRQVPDFSEYFSQDHFPPIAYGPMPGRLSENSGIGLEAVLSDGGSRIGQLRTAEAGDLQRTENGLYLPPDTQMILRDPNPIIHPQFRVALAHPTSFELRTGEWMFISTNEGVIELDGPCDYTYQLIQRDGNRQHPNPHRNHVLIRGHEWGPVRVTLVDMREGHTQIINQAGEAISAGLDQERLGRGYAGAQNNDTVALSYINALTGQMGSWMTFRDDRLPSGNLRYYPMPNGRNY